MPEINNAIALGVQTPTPQKTADIIAPISSLANLQLVNANAEHLKAETGQIGLTSQFSQGKLGALADYNARIKGGEQPEAALQKSGLAAYDPAGATSMLGNIKGGLDIGAVRNYKPGAPESLAGAGPEMVGKELANQKTNVETQKAATEVTQAHMQMYGQIGNVMTAPGGATPQGRAIAADMARKAGWPEAKIQQALSLPDDQYVVAGQHLQVASMSPEKYMDTSGQTKFNQGLAGAATQNEKIGSGEVMSRGPAAYAVAHGLPVPGMSGGAPSSGVVGSPSLGNFAPAAALPQAGPPTLAGPGGAPLQPGLTPPTAAPSGPAAAAPATPSAVPVRNVNAVSVPSVGVNVPPEIAAAARKNGVSENYLTRTAQIESNFNPNAYNAQSKAAGPFQFVPSTGAKYLNGSSPFDLAGSADAAARLAVDNKASLTKSLGRDPTDAELYLAHQQGAGGAAKLLANPNARAGDLVGNSAIASNGGNPNAPASAFTNLWTTKFNGGVGKSIPGGALSPNVTPLSPVASANLAPGAIAPLAAALTPAQPAPLPAPAAAAPLQAAPAPAAAAAPPAITPVHPVTSAAPPPTGLAADNTRPLLPQGYQPVDAGPSKAVLAEQEAQGAAYGKLPEELDKAATAAKTTNTTLDEMSAAAKNFRMGKWSDHEQSLRESLQAVATTFGVKNPDLERATGSYQDLGKLSGQVVRQAAHELGSRTGVQELQMITKTNPNAEMTEEGFNTAVAQMKGLNDFAIAKQQASADWKAANGNSLGPNKSGKDFQATWNAQASPAAFVLQRMKEDNPIGLQNLISTLSKTAEGKAALKNMQSQWDTANNNGWLRK